MKNFKKVKNLLGIALILVFLWFAAKIFVLKSLPSDDVLIYDLERGMSVTEIADDLKEKGIIKSPFYFKIYAVATGSYKNLQAGKYEISPSMTIAYIVNKFATGDVIRKNLTIIEGWTLNNIASYLESREFSDKEEFLSLSQKDWSGDFNFLKDKPVNLSLEGYLFPDTYQISDEKTAEDLIKNMLSNFDRKLTNELREEIVQQGKSIFQIVTMASMIEKEVRSLEDKKIVSGILWKRFEVGMPLQIDATVNYITGKNAPRVSIADTQIDSPYNTYKYYGLPRGPISNPGLNSILAAIYPTETDYWYYISARETGETIFSRTLMEHNEAIAKYLNNANY